MDGSRSAKKKSLTHLCFKTIKCWIMESHMLGKEIMRVYTRNGAREREREGEKAIGERHHLKYTLQFVWKRIWTRFPHKRCTFIFSAKQTFHFCFFYLDMLLSWWPFQMKLNDRIWDITIVAYCAHVTHRTFCEMWMQSKMKNNPKSFWMVSSDMTIHHSKWSDVWEGIFGLWFNQHRMQNANQSSRNENRYLLWLLLLHSFGQFSFTRFCTCSPILITENQPFSHTSICYGVKCVAFSALSFSPSSSVHTWIGLPTYTQISFGYSGNSRSIYWKVKCTIEQVKMPNTMMIIIINSNWISSPLHSSMAREIHLTP